MRTVYLLTTFIAISSLVFCDSDEGVVDSFGKLPLYFIENQGQLAGDAAFYVKGSDKILYFTSEGVTFALTSKQGEDGGRQQASARVARGPGVPGQAFILPGERLVLGACLREPGAFRKIEHPRRSLTPVTCFSQNALGEESQVLGVKR